MRRCYWIHAHHLNVQTVENLTVNSLAKDRSKLSYITCALANSILEQ